MIIDCHIHPKLNGFDLEHTIKYFNNNNIDMCWLISCEDLKPVFRENYINISPEEIFEFYQKYPDRFIPMYAPSPERDNLEALIHKYLSLGFKGVAELKVSYNWESSFVQNLLEITNSKALPLLFHMEQDYYVYNHPKNNLLNKKIHDLLNWGFNGISRYYIEKFIRISNYLKTKFSKKLIYFPGYLLNIAELEMQLKKYPNVKFIGHGPFTWKNIDANYTTHKFFDKVKIKEKGIIIDLLDKYHNFYIDVSGKSGYFGLKRDPSFTKWFLEEFYEKVLFGTDNINNGVAKLIYSAKLPKYKLSKIMGQNSIDLL